MCVYVVCRRAEIEISDLDLLLRTEREKERKRKEELGDEEEVSMV